MKTELGIIYLFRATYKDGGIFNQPPSDLSSRDESKSAFYDVDLPNLSKFALVHKQTNEIICEVNLENGVFKINGRAFSVGDADVVVEDKELVYFRRLWRTVELGKNGKLSDPLTYKMEYYVGYRGKDLNGKEVTKIIGIE